MLHNPVSSSNIRSIGYDATHKILEIEFTSGEVYQYFDFLPHVYEAFMNASSKGRFFATLIKDRFRFVKVT